MVHLDTTSSVLQWSSEEIVIPYRSPVDNHYHRYFPDFFVRTDKGSMVLEVKPLSQSVPPKTRKRVTHQYISEVMTYGINQAKWKAAEEYCKDRGWTFKVITEEDIYGKK